MRNSVGVQCELGPRDCSVCLSLTLATSTGRSVTVSLGSPFHRALNVRSWPLLAIATARAVRSQSPALVKAAELHGTALLNE